MYRAPVEEIAFALKQVAGVGEARSSGAFPALTDDLLNAVLSEAGRFATDVLAPLDRVGDREGVRLAEGAVQTASGWRSAYQQWVEAGWSGVAAPERFGGQGLPVLISAATQEMWNGACVAFALCPMLTMGAVEALEKHATPALQALYLPRLVSGEWTATMNLTEPQAGSDLSEIRTRAERRADGTYRIFGQKIFITYGEHDLTENIVHLVLARLPDAPTGSKGISLFLVPKMIPDGEGKPSVRNDVVCAGIEHKLGIHASPTCTMIYGDGCFGPEPGAVAWLVGEEHRGLACMFTMMNNARLMVGIQGVGQAERALQLATSFAQERRQGRAPGERGERMSVIAEHPDVRRMLMTMRALTVAARAICYACAMAIDLGGQQRGEGRDPTGIDWPARAGLLTPIAKAFATDCAFEVASLGVQVHGGMGYIEETGAAQILRDSRISSIYEGTNGIQAVDLVTRKLPAGGGAHVRSYIDELRDVAERARRENRPDFGRMGQCLGTALDDLAAASAHLLGLLAEERMPEALAGATPYLRLFGLAAGGAYLANGALASIGEAGPAPTQRIATARFFAERLLPECAALRASIVDGAEAVLGYDLALGMPS
jgi:acyl-CoA dehydrogenase